MRTNSSPFMQGFESLPQTLAIFPLPNVVLLPGASLPLNIFEPRYLNMLQDAMQSSRLIGMIQPIGEKADDLQYVGCAGRVTHYVETRDGRLEIVLSGLCRFRVGQELPTVRGYRLVQPNWAGFESDYDTEAIAAEELSGFRSILRRYLNEMDIEADWERMEQLDGESLVSNLVMALPLDPADKQLLLEAADVKRRMQLLGSLLELPAAQQGTKH